MPFASALSEHPDARVAIAEAAGAVREQLAGAVDLAWLFVTGAHRDVVPDVAEVIHHVLAPATLVGATAVAVLAGARGVEDGPGLSLFAAQLPGEPRAVRLRTSPHDDGVAMHGLAELVADAPHRSTLLLVADPFQLPVGPFLDELGRIRPDIVVIGGLASAADQPGGNRLLLDRSVHTDGAVGVLLAPTAAPRPVVSQGCRPIGQPWTVTRAEAHLVYELGGRPALERLMATIDALDERDRELVLRGLHCGIVADERRLDFERGDFLIRGVLGADRSNGAIAIGDVVPVGATVQFQVRDADTAGEDLTTLLHGHVTAAGALGQGHPAGALVFTCNGRGSFMFGDAHHDAAIVAETLGDVPAAGMFCAGELGPIGLRNALHGFTASVAVFREAP
jgi:small ligand-binding sensory domain FIST